jgi:hypothetical protein
MDSELKMLFFVQVAWWAFNGAVILSLMGGILFASIATASLDVSPDKQNQVLFVFGGAGIVAGIVVWCVDRNMGGGR